MTKIKEIDANLKHITQKYIVHGVSCDGKMPNTGTAALLQKSYPKMHTDFVNWCKLHESDPSELLGTILVTELDDKVIISMFIQEAYGSSKQEVNQETIRKCFKELNKYAKANSISEIVMPKIGTGGSAKWDDIKKVIQEESVDFIPVVSIKSK
jgi:O-acetyl-ADP-ribose deacetylase (regulator of RNase III)